MNVVRTKDGVQMTPPPSSAGMRMIAALVKTARQIGHDLTITSGTEGAHTGTFDPHHTGDAFDVHTNDLTDAHAALLELMTNLGEYDSDVPVAKDQGLVTHYFFGWLENEGAPNEHIHIQLRRNVDYPSVEAT